MKKTNNNIYKPFFLFQFFLFLSLVFPKISLAEVYIPKPVFDYPPISALLLAAVLGLIACFMVFSLLSLLVSLIVKIIGKKKTIKSTQTIIRIKKKFKRFLISLLLFIFLCFLILRYYPPKPEPFFYFMPPDYQVGQNISVKLDKQNNTVNLILKEEGKETVIESVIPDTSIRTDEFSEFLKSSNNKYLHYVTLLIPEYSQSRILNLESKEKINLNITAFDKGFTSDNKYFYGCSEDGLFDGGVEIYNLEQMKVVYQKPYGLMKCEYDQKNNILKVTYKDDPSKDFKYYFDSGKIVN